MTEPERLAQIYEAQRTELEEAFAKADDQGLSPLARDEAQREALDRVFGQSVRQVVRLTLLAGVEPKAWLDVTVTDHAISEVKWVGTATPLQRLECTIEHGSPMWRLAEYHVQAGWL
jgi:hypothetical protein